MATELVIPREDLTPLQSDAPVTGQSRLASLETCRAVIARYARDSEPCGNEAAAKLAAILIGSYPGREIADPATYSRAIVSVLAEQCAEIGAKAIDRLTRRLKYLPTRAEVTEAIEEVASERRVLAYRAQLHIREHERRAQERQEQAERQLERQRLREILSEAWNDWWSIPVLRRMAGGMPEQFAEGWRAAADKRAFCDSWGVEVV